MKVGFIGGKFLPLHQGHIYAIMKASSIVDKLYVILSSSETRDKELCLGKCKYPDSKIRLSWLGELTHDMENISIIHIEDDAGTENYDWKDGSDKIKKSIPEHIDYIFSSEIEYSDIFKKLYPESKHIIIDPNRNSINISATKIRESIYSHWTYMPSYVREFFVKKILITGTESCGKSTLTKKLAKIYNTKFCRETGRDYCEKYSNNLTVEMFDSIAMEHYLEQKHLLKDCKEYLFVDSDSIVTNYYLNLYYGKKSNTVENINTPYDLVLYLEPDVEWVPDGFRFAETNRENLNNNLKDMYKSNGINYVSISGNWCERLEKSIKEINDIGRSCK